MIAYDRTDDLMPRKSINAKPGKCQGWGSLT